MPRLTPHVPGMRELGEYVREQRENAHLSVRQLSAVAGISNPYLSQIERGLRRPSAEILNSLAKGLQISAESLYVRAGLLDDTRESSAVDVRLALSLDRHLTDRQRRIMLDLYDSFVPRDHGIHAPTPADEVPSPSRGGAPAMPPTSTSDPQTRPVRTAARATTPDTTRARVRTGRAPEMPETKE